MFIETNPKAFGGILASSGDWSYLYSVSLVPFLATDFGSGQTAAALGDAWHLMFIVVLSMGLVLRLVTLSLLGRLVVEVTVTGCCWGSLHSVWLS